MSAPTTTSQAPAPADGATTGKGLGAGRLGLLGSVVIGVSTIAPAYTLSGALGPTAAAVGEQLPAIFLVGFVPMLLVAVGYRQLNKAMPDAGTTFTWVSKAFGPFVGWMGGWGLLAATILVLSNLAGIAVDFFYLALAQITGNPGLADLTRNVWVNIVTCLAFMAAACWIAYRSVETTKIVQYVLVGFQVAVLVWFSIAAYAHVAGGTAPAGLTIDPQWFDPFAVDSFSAFAAGVSLSVFIYWGWDVVLTLNEETKGSAVTPGKAATSTIFVIVVLYMTVGLAVLTFAGVGEDGLGLGNPDIQGNVFAALAGPVMGPTAILMSLAVLSSSAASLQSTIVSPARTMLAMGHYGALSPKYARITPRFQSPGYATVASAVIASVFYAVMRVVSEDVLWDTITALGIMVCFYYGATALACVWYFRSEARDPRALLTKIVAPGVGGVLLLVFFVQTSIDSMDPEYGSGSHIGGVGLVFVLGVGVLALGLVVMAVQRVRRPEFFRGQVLPRGSSADGPSAG
ncbi:amino acid/polyamine/organocation transporter (APC superfamily) [Isoptericola jiangsuensis]|uniref:Amino acid/polyamine/organocation transporter (APC superfamily) n=1 Tax=Isoptericola jiangsuensis TaxID=548579 RepID=A0A2A9EXG9_9MICO|nr:APC family permease [Isoptericola jiangsuensis]PFG42869.1 amino acid/polyamine/organocation transporter (APC superfamily) [Isoptericola jiangsuensis]